jgi:SulP family sulfate permease
MILNALASRATALRDRLLAPVNFVDTTGCDALLSVIKELQSRGIIFAFARVRDEVRERLRLAGIEAVLGSANFHERVTDGVRAWQLREGMNAVSVRGAEGPQ